jgi:hypothetical protein
MILAVYGSNEKEDVKEKNIDVFSTKLVKKFNIWFLILKYLEIKHTMSEVVLTNRSVYENINKFKWDDSNQSMIQLLHVPPAIEEHLKWISTQHSGALLTFLTTNRGNSVLSLLQNAYAADLAIENPFDRPNKFMHLILAVTLSQKYRYLYDFRNQKIFKNHASETGETYDIIHSPIPITMFYRFIFHNFQIWYRFDDIKYIFASPHGSEFDLTFSKTVNDANIDVAFDYNDELFDYENHLQSIIYQVINKKVVCECVFTQNINSNTSYKIENVIMQIEPFVTIFRIDEEFHAYYLIKEKQN